MDILTRKTLAVFFRDCLKDAHLGVIVLLLLLGAVAADMAIPLVFKEIIDTASSSNANRFSQVNSLVWLLIAIEGGNQLNWRLLITINNRFQPRVMQRLQVLCFNSIIYHSQNFFSNEFSGRIVAQLNRFAPAFESIADAITFNLIRVVLRVTSIIILIFLWWPTLGFAILGWAIAYVAFVVIYSIKTLRYDIAVADAESATTAHLSDCISNSGSMILFANRLLELSTFFTLTKSLQVLRTKSWDIRNLRELIQGGATVSLYGIVLFKSLSYYESGLMTIGSVVLLQSYTGQIIEITWALSQNFKAVFKALANANEMTNLLERPHEIIDHKDAVTLQVSTGAVNFDNVTFAYNGTGNLIENFNLKIPGGQKTAFIGRSGAGKSTLVKLLLRLSEVSSGAIKIDGTDISKATLDSLYKSVTLVPQEPELFHRTLLENIKYGKQDATFEEVEEAARAANCHDFIIKLEDQYNTLVGERGVKLSGGQRQRIAIARAILKNSIIIIMDEATSSLDSESEKLIQEAMHNLMRNKTVIVIAHRLSTIAEMDHIVVIEEGGILEQGTHSELLNTKGGLYSELWGIQAGGFRKVA